MTLENLDVFCYSPPMSQELRAFVSRKFPMGKDPAVQRVAKYEAERKGEQVIPNNADSLVENYLGRFRSILERPNPADKDRGITALKRILLGQLVTKYEDIPDSYWKSYEVTLRSRGQAGDWASLPPDKQAEMRQADTAPLLEDQQASIEEWFDYFVSEDSADIPDELKYWVFRSLTQLQAFEKAADNPHIEFTRRSKGSLKKYPDLNQDALRQVVDAMMKKFNGETVDFEHDIEEEDRTRFNTFLQAEKFGDLYAWETELMNPIPEHLLPITAGEWKKYPQGSDSTVLADTLRGKGTGLCIPGKGAAKRYLETGDLYVYFSNDENGQPTFPRAAIHAKDNKIAEVRGVAYKQNLDPYITPKVSEKLAEFSDGKLYQKKTSHMEQLTVIEQKTKDQQALNPKELAFLYAVNEPIQGFGYQPDPRILELRKGRDQQADMRVIFECTPEQIAHSQAEVTPDTKAYIGSLYPNIFQELYHLEHIYTQFPEKKMRRTQVEIGGKTKDQLQDELDAKHIEIWDWTKQLLEKMTTSTERTVVEIVKLTVADLGFPSGCTTTQLFQRATELGLEFCPAELGPHYRLQYMDQPENEYVSIGMEPITGSRPYPDVFYVRHDGGMLELSTDDARPVSKWNPGRVIVFRLRKVEALAA